MRLFELTEGRHDPHIHKAIFMLGGPGSGKTHVAKKLTGSTGLRTVNVDEFYEMLRDKQGIQGRGFDDKLYKYSGNLTQKKLDLFLKGRLGILVDGTGRKVQRLAQMKDELESLGYDTMAVFVNTDINTALDRNEERRRKADADWVRKVHADLQQKLGELQSIFGQNMLIVDNSEDRKDFADAQKAVDKFLNSPNKRPVTWPVTEAMDEQQKADMYKTVAQAMLRRAKDYISEVGQPLVVTYRGYEKSNSEPFQRDYRDDRRPKDSTRAMTDVFNLAISAMGGKANRNNAIFASGSLGTAMVYGEAFVVFPMGDFNYTWHFEVIDWYNQYHRALENDNTWDAIKEALGTKKPVSKARELLRDAENHKRKHGDEEPLYGDDFLIGLELFIEMAEGLVVDKGLRDALNNNTEIMISCPGGYYYIPEADFFKYVAPYFEINGLQVEDSPPRT